MTDAHALSIVRKFIDDNQSDESIAVNVRFVSAGVTVQRTGGNLPAVVRTGETFGKAIEKLFEGTSYAA